MPIDRDKLLARIRKDAEAGFDGNEGAVGGAFRHPTDDGSAAWLSGYHDGFEGLGHPEKAASTYFVGYKAGHEARSVQRSPIWSRPMPYEAVKIAFAEAEAANATLRKARPKDSAPQPTEDATFVGRLRTLTEACQRAAGVPMEELRFSVTVLPRDNGVRLEALTLQHRVLKLVSFCEVEQSNGESLEWMATQMGQDLRKATA